VRNASNWIGLGEMKKAGSVVETSARFTIGSFMQLNKTVKVSSHESNSWSSFLQSKLTLIF
jgi:hypothetical protein